MKNTQVFLDLEETVIDSWDSGLLVNSAQVRDWLAQHEIKGVDIFSFAVWNQQDQLKFDREFAPILRKALDVGIRNCITVQSMMEKDSTLTGINWQGDITEFICLRGKVGAFTNWCRLHHAADVCVLIDDIVPNMDIINHDTGGVIKFINVRTLK
jgi:hypothetical protein